MFLVDVTNRLRKHSLFCALSVKWWIYKKSQKPPNILRNSQTFSEILNILRNIHNFQKSQNNLRNPKTIQENLDTLPCFKNVDDAPAATTQERRGRRSSCDDEIPGCSLSRSAGSRNPQLSACWLAQSYSTIHQSEAVWHQLYISTQLS